MGCQKEFMFIPLLSPALELKLTDPPPPPPPNLLLLAAFIEDTSALSTAFPKLNKAEPRPEELFRRCAVFCGAGARREEDVRGGAGDGALIIDPRAGVTLRWTPCVDVTGLRCGTVAVDAAALAAASAFFLRSASSACSLRSTSASASALCVLAIPICSSSQASSLFSWSYHVHPGGFGQLACVVPKLCLFIQSWQIS